MRRGLFGLALVAALVATGLWPAVTEAAVQGIGVSPTSVETTLAPGTTQTGEITVINDGATDVTYRVYASDYRVSGEDYVGDFSDRKQAANVSPVSWFSLPRGNFVVKSRTEEKFAYTLAVPATAAVGGHYAAVFVETVPPPGRGGAFVSRVERIGTLFYLGVSGDVRRAGNVLPLEVPRLQSVPPVRGSLRVRNDGNLHFLAEGTVQLASPFGLVGKAQAFRGEVLPGTTRRFDLSLPTGAPMGLYRVAATVRYLDRTEQLSRWMLLMPQLTFMIVAGTVLLLVAVGVAMMLRKLRRVRP